MNLGKLGVWCATDTLTAAQAAAFAQRLERWGYGALWLPEAFGRNVLVHASWLLANTERLIVATGIASLYARDPAAMAGARATLNEQSSGRFLLGIGVSHVPLVEGRGHSYQKPVATMRAYLQAMQSAPYMAPPPTHPGKTVIAALGPKMLALAGEMTDGAHPYLVTPEHTARARQILGPGKWLCPEQKIVLNADAGTARTIARKALAIYLQLDNYRRNLMSLGFGAEDLDHGGSDALVDALVAWGDEAAIRRRIQAHWDAGADHVCLQSLVAADGLFSPPDERALELLAPARD
jgi:probable F420-dependent oxidoreductase